MNQDYEELAFPEEESFPETAEQADNPEQNIKSLSQPLVHDKWKILIVDDDEDTHKIMKMALNNIKYNSRELKILDSYNEKQTVELIDKHDDLAIIFLDMIMDTDESGINVINAVREKNTNQNVQIILITGQPDKFSEHKMILDYSINGYLNKNERVQRTLYTITIVALRAYNSMITFSHQFNDHNVYSNLVLDGSTIDDELKIYKLMIIDDDIAVHDVTEFALKTVSRKLDYSIDIIHAYSATEAKTLINVHPDTALILLDMVMETDHAGLDVIKYIRNVRKLVMPRIVVRTGEQGKISLTKLIMEYDINDFKTKTELRVENLFSVVHTSFRAYSQIHQLERQKKEHYILATHDPLTKLPNRAMLRNYLQRAIALSRRKGEQFSGMMIDLDNFKNINDTLGHEAGDELLIKTVERIQLCLRDTDVLARFGGDEFFIVLEGLTEYDNVREISERIISKLSEPYTINNQVAHIGASIGICINTENSVSQIIKEADIAMYASKDKGGNTYHYFDQEMDSKVKEKVSLSTQLREAVEKRALTLVYQPKVNISNNKIAGFEVLMRWKNEQGISVPPAQFVPMLEEIGMIEQVTSWQIKKVGEQLHQWKKAGSGNFHMAINFSPYLFTKKMFLENLQDLIESCIDPEFLSIEITENALVDYNDLVVDTLKKLQSIGCMISMDDFGTGYSSLSLLNKFAFDELKVDRSFIKDIMIAKEKGRLVETIISMVKIFDIRNIVFEGVEEKEVHNWLYERCCNGLIQGYLYSPAVSAEKAWDLLFDYNC